MSNFVTKALHGVEVAALDVVKAAETAVSLGAKVIRVVEDVRAMSPEFKTALAQLVNDAKAIAVPLGPVLASGGQNVVVDIAALEPVIVDIVKLIKDFVSFLPTLEEAVKKVGADVTA